MVDEFGNPRIGAFVVGVLVIVLLFWLKTTVAMMPTGTIGVVTSFGRVTGRELHEGFNFKAPYPFEAVSNFDIRVQKDQASTQAATSDLQDVNATLAVNYHLEAGKVGEIFQTIGIDYKNRIIDPTIQEVFKASTARFTASELLTKRPEVKEAARIALAERLHPRGIILDDISIVNFSFSDDFNKAIEQSQVAKQQVVQAQQELEKVKVEAAQKIATAQAEAEAQRLKKETLTPELVQLKAIERWNGVMPTVVGQGQNILNIPLTK